MSATKDKKNFETKTDDSAAETAENKAVETKEAKPEVEKKESEVPVQKLPGHKINTAEYARTAWRAEPASGVEFEEVLKPEYWTHVAKRMKRGDVIEVFAEDGSYYAELLVVNCGDQWASVKTKGHMSLKAKTAVKRPDYETKWKGEQALWSVIRTKDSKLMQDKFPTEDQAREWIEQHIKNTGI